MREEFEKLPHILELMQYVVCFDGLKYVSENQRTADYLNGAWYSYQEQQKRVDQLLDIINTGLKIEHNMNNQIHSLKEKVKLLEPFAQDILK